MLTKASWQGHYLGQSALLNESQRDWGVSSESHWLDL